MPQPDDGFVHVDLAVVRQSRPGSEWHPEIDILDGERDAARGASDGQLEGESVLRGRRRSSRRGRRSSSPRPDHVRCALEHAGPEPVTDHRDRLVDVRVVQQAAERPRGRRACPAGTVPRGRRSHAPPNCRPSPSAPRSPGARPLRTRAWSAGRGSRVPSPARGARRSPAIPSPDAPAAGNGSGRNRVP